MQGMDDIALYRASEQISQAYASAERCTGTCTTYISLSTQHIWNMPVNNPGQPEPWTTSYTLANVACLELQLTCFRNDSDDGCIEEFANRMLQRLPNLLAVRLWCDAPYSISPNVPLIHLKHLELGLGSLEPLDGMAFAAMFSLLETARISASMEPDAISELDVSGCRHLRQLTLADTMVYQLSKPPGCTLRVEMVRLQSDDLEASGLQQGLAEVNEVLLSSKELYSLDGLVAKACMPKLEVIRCDGWGDHRTPGGDSSDDDDTDESDDAAEIAVAEHDFLVTNMLGNCMRHSGNLPALRSILFADNAGMFVDHPVIMAYNVMVVRIPADLGGVQELMFATVRPLALFFESACSAGGTLETFCAVAREVRVGAGPLADIRESLSGRGLTLSMVEAEEGHRHYPSECLYVHSCSMPQLSYDDAISALNARVERWGENKTVCGQCGACFSCLRKAGILDSP